MEQRAVRMRLLHDCFFSAKNRDTDHIMEVTRGTSNTGRGVIVYWIIISFILVHRYPICRDIYRKQPKDS